MSRFKWVLVFVMVLMLLSLPLASAACGKSGQQAVVSQKTLYIGGPFSLTGPFADDSRAILAGYQDYAKYVNDNHILAPWAPDLKFPTDINLQVLWADDGYDTTKMMSIYEDQKSKGMLVTRNDGTDAAAMAPKMVQDKIGGPSMSADDLFFQSPLKTVFVHFPSFSNCMAADAEYFMEQWKAAGKTTQPKVAIFTANVAFGMDIVNDQLINYLKGLGFDYVGAVYADMVVTSPPTTQLMWLKDHQVNLAIGNMIRAGADPVIKEANRLGMGWGPQYTYQIMFGYAYPVSISPLISDMHELANGVISSGGMPDWDDPSQGIHFCLDLQDKYEGGFKNYTIGYPHGIVEAMVQVDALRLALQNTPVDKLTSEKVLTDGFEKISNLDTKGIAASTLTFGPDRREGLDKAVVAQVVNGKEKNTVGLYPIIPDFYQVGYPASK